MSNTAVFKISEWVFVVFIWIGLFSVGVWVLGLLIGNVSAYYVQAFGTKTIYDEKSYKKQISLSVDHVQFYNNTLTIEGEYGLGMSSWRIRIYDEAGTLLVDKKVGREPDVYGNHSWKESLKFDTHMPSQKLLVYVYPDAEVVSFMKIAKEITIYKE